MVLLVPIVIVPLALDVFCLVDISHADEVYYLPKWAWAIIIIVDALARGNWVPHLWEEAPRRCRRNRRDQRHGQALSVVG